jgi:O-succinylbenzoic acid--CoA ligase
LQANAQEASIGSSTAVDFEGARLSHAELASGVASAVRSLSELGLVRGDIVAILAPPSLAGVCLLHAFLEAGIVMMPLNARLSEAELIEALVSTRVTALLVDSEADPLHARVARAAHCELITFRPGLAGSAGPLLRRGRKPGRARASAASSDGGGARRAALAEQGAALILRTSGTTGRPKGAVLSLGNLIASATASQQMLSTSRGDRWLLCMPLFHIGGLSILVRSVLDASSVVLHAQFEAARVAEALTREGITCVSLVATMLQRLIEVRGEVASPASLRVVLLGGGPATQALLARAESLGYPVAPTYGLTEAASQVATRPPGKRSPDPQDLAAGLEALPGVELRIANGVPTANGVEGEIEVRGPNLMLGYLDAPEATAKVLRDGWLSTGDFGRLDSAGRLRVLDRRSDLILSGGENIYPAEVESVLTELDEVEEAAVVGRADAEFGARPIAFVVARAGAVVDVAALQAHCEARLARFKVPVEFRVRDALPRTASGKLMRRVLQAERASD